MCRDDVNNLSDYLDDLNQRGALPEVVPHIIQERLEKDLCICGTKISENKSVEEYLKSQLNTSMLPGESDALVQLRSSLTDWQRQTKGELSFSKSVRFKLGNLAKSRSEIAKLDKDISEGNSKLDLIGDQNIQDLKRRLIQHRELQQEAFESLTKLKAFYKIQNDEINRLKPEYISITKKSHRFELQSRKNEVCEDLIGIVKGIISSMGADTLEEVSLEMNKIFESINVQEGNTSSLIRRVLISPDFEIVVEGSTGKNLAPSTDISGAQKRALTLAFIFATVKVSGYDLPNFIDTPLGTQSGEVKRSMVEFTAKNTRQCILFLTASEIAGVEPALRQYTSKYYTLSHADHYPNELVNEPTVPTKSAFVCGCSIDESCIRCERKPLLSN
jgi:DNA sulfur modification protein DndD